MAKRKDTSVVEDVPAVVPEWSPPHEVTRWWALPNGGVVEGVDAGGELQPPEGAVEISREEYEQRLAVLKSEHAAYVDGLRAEDERRTREDFDALRAAGIPEATARRMSGYTGEL
ncbi:hypothetical protein [Nonomuraea recticatena]|uniref:Uncharacterized protein n=1 Tax=Nonomuraea recticatena TaxID=46178 RepID=A0ABP6F8J2_9ACTN